jgi:segregation and condensation protein A
MAEIHLPVFEGPLDLLLHLIERDDLDITAVSLVVVTDQYLKAIHDGEGFEPGALAEFVSIGAKLIYLKSRALLPRAPQDGGEMDDDEVGRELVDLLREYKRYTQVVTMLEQRQNAGLRNYTRMAPPPARSEPETGLESVTVELLTKIMRQMLERTPAEPRAVIQRDSAVTLSQRVADFRERLRHGGKFSFRLVMGECRTRLEVVVSFMAILELLTAGECYARQTGGWAYIVVVGRGVVGRR